MAWIGVCLFIVAYGCILLFPYLRRKRAAAARESPGRVALPLPARELRDRLKRLSVDHPEIDVDVRGEMILVGWNLEDAKAHARVHEDAAKPTFQLELQLIEQDAVNVRYSQGVISWEPPTDDGVRPEPSIVWRWPLELVGGSEAPENRWAPASRGFESRRDLRHLVELVRHVVLDSGYSWQPVLELTPGLGATSNLTDVDREAWRGKPKILQSD